MQQALGAKPHYLEMEKEYEFNDIFGVVQQFPMN